ncbi:unnamed protein product [Brachionus calyciflorus]|uniref:Uncharacterized protein n=1 Tax=Brachionus calyciflorus TaxID=104777 RepID=A0A813Y183_9BILA|nr:unnamed protein product [Brachionus calyciflorus]
MKQSFSSLSLVHSNDKANLNSNPRFYCLEEFSSSRIRIFRKKFFLICSVEYVNKNKENKLKTSQIRQKFKEELIPIPSFQEWLKKRCRVEWDNSEKKLVLIETLDKSPIEKENYKVKPKKSKKSHPKKIKSVRETLIGKSQQIIGPLVTNFEENAKDFILDNYEYDFTEILTNSNLESLPLPKAEKNELEDETFYQVNTILESPKQLGNNRALQKKDKATMKSLKEKFKTLTKSPIDDASFEVKNVIGHRIRKDRLELKIEWAADKKRGIKYKPASLCSCASAIRKYDKNVFKMYSQIKHRAYLNKKIDMSKASNPTKEVADKFYNLVGKTSKKI